MFLYRLPRKNRLLLLLRKLGPGYPKNNTRASLRETHSWRRPQDSVETVSCEIRVSLTEEIHMWYTMWGTNSSLSRRTKTYLSWDTTNSYFFRLSWERPTDSLATDTGLETHKQAFVFNVNNTWNGFSSFSNKLLTESSTARIPSPNQELPTYSITGHVTSITMFTRPHHWFLSYARWIQSHLYYFFMILFNIILIRSVQPALQNIPRKNITCLYT